MSPCGRNTMTTHINGLVQQRRNSIALPMELCLSCTKPSISCHRITTQMIRMIYIYIYVIQSLRDMIHQTYFKLDKLIHQRVFPWIISENSQFFLGGNLVSLCKLGLYLAWWRPDSCLYQGVIKQEINRVQQACFVFLSDTSHLTTFVILRPHWWLSAILQ